MDGKLTRGLLTLTAVAMFGTYGCGADSVAPPPGDDPNTGGSGTSGTSTGGVSTGGVSTGGASTGGAVSTGGVSTGGVSTGGVSTGGVSTGGAVSTGGVSTGGSATGGSVTGGMAGMSTGGIGGMSTGGTGGGGNIGGAGPGGRGGAAGAGNTGGKGGTGGSPTADDLNSGANTMGWIGCSMGENTAAGYRRIGGTRMWGPYGNGGAVVQSWTGNTSSSWQRFDQQKQMYGNPKAVWIMICIFTSGATIQEIRQMVANTKSHAPGAYIYITGQPVYHQGHVCTLAGMGGPESTDRLAQQMAMEDPTVHYAGVLGPLNAGEYENDSCHANATGQDKLGRQAKGYWGQP